MARTERTWRLPLDRPDELERLILQRHLTRRRFLGVAAFGTAGAVLAACAPVGSSTAPSSPATSSGTGQVGDTLNMATWPNYDDPEVIAAFTELTGVNVNVQVFGSTEEMEAKLRAGNSGIDIVVPSNYAVQGWIADNLIEPLDYAKLASFNRDDWNDLFMDQEFDPGNKYSLPKNWGTTGIAYRSSKITEPITSWKQFFELADTDYEGRAVIVDHQISSIGSAAVALGYSFNAIAADELAAIEEMLTSLKPKLYAISSDVQPPLRNLDSWMTIAWTGDGVQVSRDNEDARYVVAEDGGELWIDSFTVASDAPHKDAAYAFLDYILLPENAALETEFCLFPHANDKATALLPAEIRDNDVIYPGEERLANLEYASSETYNSPLRAETWARIKASS